MGIEYTHRRGLPRNRVPEASPVRITRADGSVEIQDPLPVGKAINRRGKPLKGKRHYKRRKRS